MIVVRDRSRQTALLPKCLAILLGFFAVIAAAKADVWRRFDSSRNFSIEYPAKWAVQSRVSYRLDIMDSKDGGQEGVLVAPGHVFITVTEEGGAQFVTLAQTIAKYLKDSAEIVERGRAVALGASACSSLTETNIRFSDAGVENPRAQHIPLQEADDFFCELAGHRIIVVNVLYWEADKQKAGYRNIGLRMARSIRTER